MIDPVTGIGPIDPAMPIEELAEILLAYQEGELTDDDPLHREVQRLTRENPRWKAHLRSIELIDLERLAARQDAKDLAAFATEGKIDPEFCGLVERQQRNLNVVFGEHGHARDSQGNTKPPWAAHLRTCVFCRRMRRQFHAQRERALLPAGEPLLREWLLEPLYAEALKAAREAVVTDRELVETPAITLWLDVARGVFSAIGTAAREAATTFVLQDQPRGTLLGPRLSYVLVSASPQASPQGITRGRLAAPPPGTMKLAVDRTLEGGEGTLRLLFTTTGDQVSLEPQWDPAPRQPGAYKVKLTFDNVTRSITPADKGENPQVVPLGDAANLEGKGLYFNVSRGDQPLDDFSLEFRAEPDDQSEALQRPE
jgi:hypothetical protein